MARFYAKDRARGMKKSCPATWRQIGAANLADIGTKGTFLSEFLTFLMISFCVCHLSSRILFGS
jgi:hypothetical protein